MVGDTVAQQRRRQAREEAWALRVEINVPRRGWWDRAVCRGANIENVTPDTCAGCPVRIDCLTAAHEEEADYYYSFYTRGGFHAVARQRMWRFLQRAERGAIITSYAVTHDVATGIAEVSHPQHTSATAIDLAG